MSQYFEKPKFQDFVQYYLNWSCDMETQLDLLKRDNHQNWNHQEAMAELSNKLNNIPPTNPLPASLRKNMRLIIIEMIPTVLVSDGHNFIEAIITKEAINDLRKYHSHVKFSNLRDKIIQVNKWSLQVDCVDSRQVFNSYQNLTIRLVIEQFKPQMHESLPQRLTHGAQSIFRNQEIQTLVRNYRHWFAQTMIYKNAVSADTSSQIMQGQGGSSGQQSSNIVSLDEQSDIPPMPSLSEITMSCGDQGQINQGKNQGRNTRGSMKLSSTPASNNGSFKRKTMQQFMQITQTSHNSQNTTQLSENDQLQGETFSQQNFGAIIQKTQVFRCKVLDFQNCDNVKFDSLIDLPDFKEQIQLKKSLQSKELREADIERIVIQEKGEQYYAEKKFNKSRQWQEQVEDEYRREQLKNQIEYFQVGENKDKIHSHYQSIWQRDEKEKALKRATGGYRSSRRIVGYTLGFSAASIKEKLVNMLVHSKHNQNHDKSKSVSKHNGQSPQKGGGRPRANSQENILQVKDPEDGKTQMQCHRNLSREPLSQFVVNQNPVFNDDTQSEQDSVDAQMNAELARERTAPSQLDDVDIVMEATQPALTSSISLFREYLDWFQQKGHDLEKVLTENEIREQELALQQKRELEAQQAEEAARQAERHAPRKSSRLRNKMQINQKGATSSQPLIKEEDNPMSQSVHEDDDEANPIAATLSNEQVFDQDQIMKDEQTPIVQLQDENQILQSQSNQNEIIQIQEESPQYQEENHEFTKREITPLPEAATNALGANQDLTIPIDTHGGQDDYLNNIPDNGDMLELDDNTINNDSNAFFASNQYNWKMNDELKQNNKNQLQNPPKNFSNLTYGPNTTNNITNQIVEPEQNQQPSNDVVEVVLNPQSQRYGTPEKRQTLQQQLSGQEEDCIAYMQISDKKPLNSDQVSIKSEPRTEKNQDGQDEHNEDQDNQIESQNQVQDQIENNPAENLLNEETERTPILDVELRLEPPKPIEEMTPLERKLFELERTFAQQKLALEKQMKEEEEKARLRREKAEQERLERERLERERAEKERLEKLEQERLEQERLEKERLEAERLEQERIQREEEERQRLEAERRAEEQRQKEEARRVLAERAAQELARRREQKKQERKEFYLKAVKDWCLQAYVAHLTRINDEIQEKRLAAEAEQRRQEEERLERERLERIEQERKRKEEEDLKVQQQIAARIEEEKSAQEALAMQKVQLDQSDDLDWAGDSNDEDEDITNENENNAPMPEQNDYNQQPENTLSDQNEQQNQGSDENAEFDYEQMDRETERLDRQRDEFVQSMSSKFGGVLNNLIRRNEAKDLTRRKIKRDENDDKLYDFLKIQNLKQEKLNSNNNRFRPTHEQHRPQTQMMAGQHQDFANVQSCNQDYPEVSQENDQLDAFDEVYLNQNSAECDQNVNMDQGQNQFLDNVEEQYNIWPSKDAAAQNDINQDNQEGNDHMQKQPQVTESYSDVDEEDVQFHETIQTGQDDQSAKQEPALIQNPQSQQQEVVEILSEEGEQPDDQLQTDQVHDQNQNFGGGAQEIVQQQEYTGEQDDDQVMHKEEQSVASLQSPTKTMPEVQAYTEKPNQQSQGQQSHSFQSSQIAPQPMTQNTVAPNPQQLMAPPPQADPAQPSLAALQAQLQALTQAVTTLMSQQQTKQANTESPPPAQQPNPQERLTGQQAPEDTQKGQAGNTQSQNDYHVPVFGSQMKVDEQVDYAQNQGGNTQNDQVQPFDLNGKRNYTQQQQTQYQSQRQEDNADDQQELDQPAYKAQRGEGDDRVDKNGGFQNLQEFVEHQRMQAHKAQIREALAKRGPGRQRHQGRPERGPSAPSTQAQGSQHQRPARSSSQQRPMSSGGSMHNPNHQSQPVRQRGQSQERPSGDHGQIRRMPPRDPRDGRPSHGQHPPQSQQQRPMHGRPMGGQQQQRGPGAVNGQSHTQPQTHQHGQGYGNNGGQGSPQKQSHHTMHGGHGHSQGGSPSKRQIAPQSQQVHKRHPQMGSSQPQHHQGMTQGYNRAPNPHHVNQQSSRPAGHGGPPQNARPNHPGAGQLASSSSQMGGAKRYIHSQQPGQGHLKDPQSTAHFQRLYPQQEQANTQQQVRQQKNMSPRKQFVQNGQYQQQMRQQRNILNDEN